MDSIPSYPQDMQDALDKFGREAEQIITSFRKKLDLQKQPPIIYHYTDDVGLRGILETGQLWLTDIFNLNDPSELNHGFTRAIEVLNSLVVNGPPESKAFARQLTYLSEQKGIQGSAEFFVCSFSSCGDDLGQWRAYADNGRGYAVGFDAEALGCGFVNGQTTIPNSEVSYAATFPITYKDAELARIHRKIIEKMLGLVSLPHGRNLQDAAIKSYIRELSVSFMTHTIHAALFFKHEAYNNEQEHRFLEVYSAAAPPSKMKLRSRPYSLIKYKEFDWRSVAAKALRQIVVGPAADHTKASQFARDCLRSFHPETVPINCSVIPYRAV
jgi:hypothetical protein